MICVALENRMTLAVGTCHSRAGGVNVEFNESSTATSGQDVALCGHQTARQYTILPPFQAFSLPLLWPHSLFGRLRNTVLCSLCSSWTQFCLHFMERKAYQTTCQRKRVQFKRYILDKQQWTWVCIQVYGALLSCSAM